MFVQGKGTRSEASSYEGGKGGPGGLKSWKAASETQPPVGTELGVKDSRTRT